MIGLGLVPRSVWLGDAVSRGFSSSRWTGSIEARRVCCLDETLLLEDDCRNNDPSLRGDEGRGGTALGTGLKFACGGDVVDTNEGKGRLKGAGLDGCDSGVPLA